jgi:O-antigen/teichoic acid export membrane protein
MTETVPKNDSLLIKFVREVSYTGAGTGFTVLFGMVNTMILARYLPRYEYGIFLLLMILTSFLGMISAFGLNTAVIPSIASAAKEDKNKVVNSAITFRFLTFGLVSVIFFLGQRWFLLLFGESDIGELAIFVPFMLVTQGYRNLLRAILQGFLRFKRMATIDLITSALNLAMIIVFVLLLKASFTGLVLAQIVSQGFACLALYWAIPGPKRLQLHRVHLLKVIRFGGPLQLNDILHFIFSNVSSLIIAALMGPGDVALLSVAGKLPGMIRRLYESFRSVYLPNLSKLLADGDQHRAHRLLNTSLRLTSFVTALGTLVSALFGREIILLLFSKQYQFATTAFVLSMLSLNIKLVGNVLGTSLVAAGDSKGPAIANVVTASVSLLANCILIPLFGINGAALTGATGSLAANPVNVWFLRRRSVSARVAEYVKPLLIVLVFGIPILYLQSVPWGMRGLLLFLFLLVCYLVSVIKRQDLLQAISVVRTFLSTRTRIRAATP